MKFVLFLEALLVASVAASGLRKGGDKFLENKKFDDKKFEPKKFDNKVEPKKFDDEKKFDEDEKYDEEPKMMEYVEEDEPEYFDFDKMKPIEGYPLQPDLLDFNPKAENEDFVLEVRGLKGNRGYGGLIQGRDAKNAPALVGQGMAISLFTLKEGAQNLIHYHPRATELLYLIKGKLEVGFTDTQGRLYKNILKEGQATIFPRALLHFQRNVGYGPARFVSMLNSENPGTMSFPRSLFTLPGNILSQAFRKELKHTKKIQGNVIPVELRNPYLKGVKGYYDGKAGKLGNAPVPEYYEFGYKKGYEYKKGGYGHGHGHDYYPKKHGYGHDQYGHDQGYGHDYDYGHKERKYTDKFKKYYFENDYYKKDQYDHQPKYEAPKYEEEEEEIKYEDEEPTYEEPKKEEPKYEPEPKKIIKKVIKKEPVKKVIKKY